MLAMLLCDDQTIQKRKDTTILIHVTMHSQVQWISEAFDPRCTNFILRHGLALDTAGPEGGHAFIKFQ